jgi:hypothetical protein
VLGADHDGVGHGGIGNGDQEQEAADQGDHPQTSGRTHESGERIPDTGSVALTIDRREPQKTGQ